jgi:type VI secretion system protein VasG
MIDAILTNTVLPRISEEFLKRMMAGQPVKRVGLAVENGDFAYNFS